MHTQNLLTIDEAARIAHVSPETIRYWKKTGRIQTVPRSISKRSGKPYGWLVPSEELEKARPDRRIEIMRGSHPGNLLTAREIAKELGLRNSSRAYFLIRRYGLERHYVDGVQYLVDGNKLWEHIQEDPELWYLTARSSKHKELWKSPDGLRCML